MPAVNPFSVNTPGDSGTLPQIPSTSPLLNPPSSGPFDPPQLQGAHAVMVGCLLMVIVLVILVEVAGVSKNAAEATGLILLGPLLILGINNSSKFASWAGNNPVS